MENADDVITKFSQGLAREGNDLVSIDAGQSLRTAPWHRGRRVGSRYRWIAHKNIPMGRTRPFDVCVRTVIADVDGNGKKAIVMADADISDSRICILDIVSKAWGCLPWNGVGGKMHVDLLENLSR
jgi:hypothetical protein